MKKKIESHNSNSNSNSNTIAIIKLFFDFLKTQFDVYE